MIPNWTHHLKTEDEKKRFKTYLHSSRGVLDRLSDMVKIMEQDLNDRELDPKSYDSPSWAAKQADNNGYRRALLNIQKLLTLDPKEK